MSYEKLTNDSATRDEVPTHVQVVVVLTSDLVTTTEDGR